MKIDFAYTHLQLKKTKLIKFSKKTLLATNIFHAVLTRYFHTKLFGKLKHFEILDFSYTYWH